MRVVMTLIIGALAATAIVIATSAQSPPKQRITLDAQSASRALDAIPAVFAVARNLEEVEIDVGPDSMASGFSDLADEPAAQDQLTAALGAYGFEGYSVWSATVRRIFATYGIIRSEGQAAPTVDRALQQVLNDPAVPQSQKDAIVSSMSRPEGSGASADEAAPSEEDLMVVIGLMPHIEATIEMMRAMQ